MKNKFYDLKTKTFRENAIKICLLNKLLAHPASSSQDLMDMIIDIILCGVETDIVQELLNTHHPVERHNDGFFIDYTDYMDGKGFNQVECSTLADIELKSAVMGADIYGNEADFKKVVIGVMLDQCDSIKITNCIEVPCQEQDGKTECKMDIKIGFDGDQWVVPTLQGQAIIDLPVLLNGEAPEFDDAEHTKQLIEAISTIAYHKAKEHINIRTQNVEHTAVADDAGDTKPAAEIDIIEDTFTLFESGDFKTEVHLMAELDPEHGMTDASVMIGDKVLFVIDGNAQEDFKRDFLALVEKHAV